MDKTQRIVTVETANELIAQFDLYQRAMHWVGSDEKWPAWESMVRDSSGIVSADMLYHFLDPMYSQYHEEFFAKITEEFEHPHINPPGSKDADERASFTYWEWNIDLLTDIPSYPNVMLDPANVLSMIASARLVKTTLWYLANDLADVAKHLHIDLDKGLDHAIAAICAHIVFKYRSFHGPLGAYQVAR